MARALATSVPGGERLAIARAIVHAAIKTYWESAQCGRPQSWSLPPLPDDVECLELSEPTLALAKSMGRAAADLGGMEASYLIGVLYTAVIPTAVRAEFGAYYTPPALCERLLEMATEAGVDWQTARVLDPACGGGAFLSPVAQRMAQQLTDCSPKIALKHIVRRLRGFELDPFAAWMSRVFLEDTLAPLCVAANTRLPNVIEVCDSLDQVPSDHQFDLVIGNPPYGRVKLAPELRERYRRSLFGHANLYGVFTDLALRFTRLGGVVAYVTPTSFLGGEYFKALRALLAQDAPPASLDFVAERRGVFADVLQETLLATYRRGGRAGVGKVHFLSPAKHGDFVATSAGSFRLPSNPDDPWIVPRDKTHCNLIHSGAKKPQRLKDYGYKVSTGPLVWNRHKTSLRDVGGKERYPLIWAESVRPNGNFEFRSEKRNHKPYFEPGAKERWVVTDFPCVLVQRTTAKEQPRRLVAAALPKTFLDEHRAVVVENHLNMVRPLNGEPLISAEALAALLNTETIDQLFRCINGSVAVSAYELEALPLPSLKQMKRIEELVREGAGQEALEVAVEAIYKKAGA